MPRPAHTAEERAAARRHVIASARQVYAEEGFGAVTLRSVARRAGCSTAALYRHFPNRVALVRALWSEAVDVLDREATDAERTIADPVDRIRAVLFAYVGLAKRDPNAFKSTFLQLWNPMPEELVLPEARDATAYRVLHRAVAEAVRASRFAAMDTHVGAQALWAAVHGAIALPLNLGEFPFADADVRTAATVEMALKGLMDRPTAG